MIRYSVLLNPTANWEVATTPNKTYSFGDYGCGNIFQLSVFITIVILCMLMMVLLLMMNE